MNRATTHHAIRNRLVASMAASVLLGVVMTAIVFAVSATTISGLATLTYDMDTMEERAATMQQALFAEETSIFDFALSGRPEAVDELQASVAREEEAYADLRAEAADLPAILVAATSAHVAAHAWRDAWAEPFIRASRADGVAGAATVVDRSEALFLPAETATLALLAALDDQRAATNAAIAATIPHLTAVVVPLGFALTALLTLLGLWLIRSINGPLARLNDTVAALVAGKAVTFTAERDDELGSLAVVLERLRLDAGERLATASFESAHAMTFNQLAELTSFARNEADLVLAAGHAIRRLVPTIAGDILLANPSQNRLTVGTAWGDGARENGALVNVDRIDRCPGIRRSSAFVAPDVADPMAVRCPAHETAIGTMLCIPMLALGKIVGVIHLESTATDAYDPEAIRLVTRVAESVGLAMANARLMQTMEGQAMTDPLTGLRNTRFFDPYLEQELAAARRDHVPLSVVMIDIDHFKQFNDTYGHPAGDEALRSFARVVSGSLRASDVAARYGGEEFIVALRHASIEEAGVVAEKLRASIEQMVVELGPGRYARITASFGVASIGSTVQDHKSLVSLADAALYRAKAAGRNRVELTSDVLVVTAPDGDRSRPIRRIAGRRLESVDPKAG